MQIYNVGLGARNDFFSVQIRPGQKFRIQPVPENNTVREFSNKILNFLSSFASVFGL